jgi:hypothetical protein
MQASSSVRADKYAKALFQNTPFGALVRQYLSADI